MLKAKRYPTTSLPRRALLTGSVQAAAGGLLAALALSVSRSGAASPGPIERLEAVREDLMARLNRERDEARFNRLVADLAATNDQIAAEPATGPGDVAAKLRVLREEMLSGSADGLALPTLDTCLAILEGAAV
ncbi:hypothetical protein [Azospirillum picis]|uniref:Secreted protein n=1 Tax=Azospirillum picis TaxID=488438 RepID=A0ABU0MVR4_9PROT|nr:hypothetical protein [Azospirillum picis]MBP2303294.1 hypothetical protein [Azospirillum picis]MDQ0537166.1 hypothetical protein [Azospirillum picis]